MPAMSAAERDAWLDSSLSATPTPTPAAEKPVVEKETAPAAKTPETPPPEGDETGASEDTSTTDDSTDQTDSGDVSSDDTADSSTATDGEADAETETAEGEEVEETPHPKRGTAAARIQDLIAENKSLRAFGEHVLSELKTKAPAAKVDDPTPAPTVSVDEPAPTLESCGYDADKFSKELTAYTKKVARAEVVAEMNSQNEQNAATAAKAKFAERAEAFGKTKPDWQVVMSNRQLPGMHEDAAKTIVLAEDGPAIAYYLAKHPDQATRISRMPREAQLVRIGEIRGQLTTATVATTSTTKPPVPKGKKPTQAPPPPTPTPAGSSTAKPSMLDGSLSMNDWVNRDRAEKAAARQNRIKMRDSMRR